MRVSIAYLITASSWLLVLNVEEVIGHGMLMEPVNRGSMWRMGYSTPKNFNDNANYCGGYGTQWYVNKGLCGPCGDEYSLEQPRPNENTGTYGTGIVVATYKAGAFVDLRVTLTANHKGFFKFNVCPLEDPAAIETEECFEKYPLLLDGEFDVYHLASTRVGNFSMIAKLPDSLTCDRCVLRWHWTAGNNWGVCTGEDGPVGINAAGCGPQENFRTCSDISIV